jgi:hypothetical protein
VIELRASHMLRQVFCYLRRTPSPFVCIPFFFFFVVLHFELRAYTLSHSTSSFL